MISIVVTNGVDIGTVVAIELFASYAVAIVAANTVSADVVVSIVFVASAVVARVSCNNDKKSLMLFLVFSWPFQANSGGRGVRWTASSFLP